MSKIEGQKNLKTMTEDIYQNIINKLILEMNDEVQKEGYTEDILKDLKQVSFNFLINFFLVVGAKINKRRYIPSSR